MPSSSRLETSFTPEIPSFNDSMNSLSWDMSHLSDVDSLLFLAFCFDMERLDSLEQV